jgi:hypothetical protein
MLRSKRPAGGMLGNKRIREWLQRANNLKIAYKSAKKHIFCVLQLMPAPLGIMGFFQILALKRAAIDNL